MNKKAKPFQFRNFGRVATGSLIYDGLDLWDRKIFVVWSRNPYGSHNLVLIDCNYESFRHGNRACLDALKYRVGLDVFNFAIEFLKSRGRWPLRELQRDADLDGQGVSVWTKIEIIQNVARKYGLDPDKHVDAWCTRHHIELDANLPF